MTQASGPTYAFPPTVHDGSSRSDAYNNYSASSSSASPSMTHAFDALSAYLPPTNDALGNSFVDPALCFNLASSAGVSGLYSLPPLDTTAGTVTPIYTLSPNASVPPTPGTVTPPSYNGEFASLDPSQTLLASHDDALHGLDFSGGPSRQPKTSKKSSLGSSHSRQNSQTSLPSRTMDASKSHQSATTVTNAEGSVVCSNCSTTVGSSSSLELDIMLIVIPACRIRPYGGGMRKVVHFVMAAGCSRNCTGLTDRYRSQPVS